MKSIIIVSFLFSCIPCFSQNHESLYIDTLSVVLCDKRELVYLFEYNSLDTLCLCNNEKATKLFRYRIGKLKLFIEDNRRETVSDNDYKIMLNFILLTGIDSEINGNYVGFSNPTMRDIERWEEWFNNNKDYICWYKEKNILFQKKCKK
jgi:hypothetical protein